MSSTPDEVCLSDLNPAEWALALSRAEAEGAVVRLGPISIDQALLPVLVSPGRASSVMLQHATFGTDVDLVATGLIQSNLEDVTFSGSASFANGVFPEQVSFLRTKFEKPVSFANAQFGQDRAIFRSVVFNDSCSFAQAQLAETTTFSGVKFLGPVMFDGANAPAKYLMFERCLFGSDLSLEGLVTGYDTKITFKECELVEGGVLDGTIVGPGALVNHDSVPAHAFSFEQPPERGRNSAITGYLRVQIEHEELGAQPYFAPNAPAVAALVKRLNVPAAVHRQDSELSFVLLVEPVGEAQWRLSNFDEPNDAMLIDSADLQVRIEQALAHFEVLASHP